MADFDLYDGLPDDPEYAFVMLEAQYRLEYESEMDRANDAFSSDDARIKYLHRIDDAIDELGLTKLFLYQFLSTLKSTMTNSTLSGARWQGTVNVLGLGMQGITGGVLSS